MCVQAVSFTKAQGYNMWCIFCGLHRGNVVHRGFALPHSLVPRTGSVLIGRINRLGVVVRELCGQNLRISGGVEGHAHNDSDRAMSGAGEPVSSPVR